MKSALSMCCFTGGASHVYHIRSLQTHGKLQARVAGGGVPGRDFEGAVAVCDRQRTRSSWVSRKTSWTESLTVWRLRERERERERDQLLLYKLLVVSFLLQELWHCLVDSPR